MVRIPGLHAEVTLANFPPNDSGAKSPGPQTAHVAWSDGDAWHIRPLDVLDMGKARTYREDDLPRDLPPEAMPSFFLYPERMEGRFDEPVVSNHLETSPSWRGNIKLRSATTSASYQGEYPSVMLNIPTGTMLSIGPMIQRGPEVGTKFIFVNMRRNPACDEATLRFVDAADLQILKTAKVRFNRCTVIDLVDLPDNGGRMIAALSDGIAGIPLYFSHTDDFSCLSMEHTHPPAEVVVFGDRTKVQQKMKSRWLSLVGAQVAAHSGGAPSA